MRNCLILLLLFLCSFSARAQVLQTDTVLATLPAAGLKAVKAAGDSLVSSFIISIPEAVKPHKHATHSEHVYILEGKGWMILDGKGFEVKKGMLVFIPKGAVHSVKTTSTQPLKVLSIQAPEFDGKDRIWVE